ncbi:hypothetical protein ACQR3V_25550 [Rhodococcus erythropolis]|uniref:hypothetical protein n=1 Tax=Rhodococcus sp. WS7 TaxID=2495445 RepID=UPI000AC58E31|nr:hypothetical protein [Rhodococcus sp. WS7]
MRSSLTLATLAASLILAGCGSQTVQQPDTATTTTETGGTWVRRLEVPDSVEKICQSILELADDLGYAPNDSTPPLNRVRNHMLGPNKDWRGIDPEGRQRIQEAFEKAESGSCG